MEINTINDLIEFLKTLDGNKQIDAEYIHVVGSQFVNIKNRPLLSSLFEDNDDHYTFKAMFY